VRQLSARVAGADPAATALAVGHLTKRPINQAAIIRNGGQPNKGSIMPKFNSSHKQLFEIAQEYGHDRAL
jgi:hypothetical protein